MDWECTDWKAWHDRMPGTTPTLHVTGSCAFPTSGYTAELRYHEPQGINPRDLLLNLVVTPPSGVSNDVVTEMSVDYTRETDARYDTVSIIDVQLGIPVEEVS